MIHCAEHVLISRPGHLLGQALHRQLLRLGHPPSHIHSGPLPDFGDARETRAFLEAVQPEQVFLIAQDFNSSGLPGQPILPPERSADANLIRAAYLCGVRRLIYVTDARVYPGTSQQPMAENLLLSALCAGTDDAAAQVQRHGLRLCESLTRDQGAEQRIDFRAAVVGEVYGPVGRGDTARRAGHSAGLVERLLRQLIEAEERRAPSLRLQLSSNTPVVGDLLFCDDAAEALVYLLELPRQALALAMPPGAQVDHINIGAGAPISLSTLVTQACLTVGYCGEVHHIDKLDDAGSPQRWLDTRRLRELAWEPLIDLECGLELTCMDLRLHNRAERGLVH